MSGEELRKILYKRLLEMFGENNVKTKWRATSESTDDFDSGFMYTPETDIAIGPFNIDRMLAQNNYEITRASNENNKFLNSVNSIADKRYQSDLLNRNPRCFLAIEVGGSGSRKHHLGDMFNASILGKVGIVVGANERSLMIYNRVYEYVNFSFQVEKTLRGFENLIVVDGNKLLKLLIEFRK